MVFYSSFSRSFQLLGNFSLPTSGSRIQTVKIQPSQSHLTLPKTRKNNITICTRSAQIKSYFALREGIKIKPDKLGPLAEVRGEGSEGVPVTQPLTLIQSSSKCALKCLVIDSTSWGSALPSSEMWYEIRFKQNWFYQNDFFQNEFHQNKFHQINFKLISSKLIWYIRSTHWWLPRGCGQLWF